ncbi:MAG: hypothetical protein K9G41_04045 [Flavobacteriales bacterium]|nr:hypothetical protein [Flavobacteriales bacterium]
MDSLLGTTGWSPKRIAFIYLMPAATGILALIIGFIALRIARTKQVHLRTFMFWLSLNGLLMYMSYIATGYLSGVNFNSKFFTGFVGLYAWLFWKDITIYGVLLLQVLLCIPVLLYFGRLVLSLNYSSSLLKQKNGKFIIWINIVFIPFLIGVLIVIAATFPMEFGYQLVRILSFLPIAFIVAIGTQLFSTKHISIIKGGMKPLPIVLLAFGIGILILISRTVLSLSIGPLW